MTITNKDLDLLMSVQKLIPLDNNEYLFFELSELIIKLMNQRQKINEKNRKRISEKRKIDKNYGRKKAK